MQNTDYIICKLKKSFFKQPKDIYLINVYVKPYNSSNNNDVNTNSGKELLDKIEEIANNLQKEGEVILCGDFNSRISQHPGMVNNDSNKFLPVSEDCLPDIYRERCSQDKVYNCYGRRFLNLVMNNQLTILNGRTLGDLKGNFTSIQRQGCSVVDYIAVSKQIESKINYLKVGEFTEYSDHKPLSLEMKCEQVSLFKPEPIESKYQAAPKRFIFNDDNKTSFLESQKSDASIEFLSGLKKSLGDVGNTTQQNITNVSQTIKEINTFFTTHIQTMASNCCKKTKNVVKKRNNNNPWFNWQTRLAKRELKKATRATSKFPDSDFLRNNFYRVKSSYKKLLSKTKTKYFENLNNDIEDGKILSWQSFKKLKKQKTDKINFDSHDMNNFEKFFKNLYSDTHKTISLEKKNEYLETADKINDSSTHSVRLNEEFTMEEVATNIKALKSGKASSIDMISNEILKSLDSNHLAFLINFFNVCFENGVYPWNENVISPLHKKGKISNPDNYRAIAVSSAIGKIFSSILLNRLQRFREENCPDPLNQLGFTKGAQTYDHILTMQTIASKYKKYHKPVYAIFVDFKKAFDSVCRQALLYKMAKIGITGKFYNVLKNMYSNSYAYIKLAGHLSHKFQTLKGTEQGHPLSPDLFKIFLYDLSQLLEIDDCPELSNKPISHLLWADDLIMLSLSPSSSHYQLEKLEKFCHEWGIEVNEIKTQVMVFRQNKSTLNNTNLKFNLNGKPLKIVDTYCYLGIVLHYSGELRTAQNTLKIKAMRAFFGLKWTVIRSKLSFKSLTTLFDSLVKPIVLYGAPIWTPNSAINTSIIKHLNPSTLNLKKFISKINRTESEKVHLSFLKWSLGVHKKASNIGVWGETGRYPLIYQSIRLTLNYYNRLLQAPKKSFVYAALMEQKKLKLSWYKNIEPLLRLDDIYHMNHVDAYRTLSNPKYSTHSNGSTNISLNNNLKSLCKAKPLPSEKFRVKSIVAKISEHFVKCWEYEKSISPKLSFYHKNKNKFAREIYLDVIKGFSRRYSMTKLRISSHNLEIERGRYINIAKESRFCKWCATSMGMDVVENEIHCLFDCDLYATLRAKLIARLNKAPSIPENVSEELPSNFSVSSVSLRQNCMKMVSPYTINNLNDAQTDIFNFHHKVLHNKNLKLKTPEIDSFINRRSYITNCISTFIYCALKKHQEFQNSMREQNCLPNTIVINF